MQRVDPGKMYFYQSDYSNFTKRKDRLADLDLAQGGDISFAYTVYNTFLDRADERVKMVDQILASPQDFAVDEELVIDKGATTYANTPEEIYDRWRKQVKYDLLLLKAEKANSKTEKSEGKTPVERLKHRYHSRAEQMHQAGPDELLEMYLTSLTTSFDPHTTYMSPSGLEDFRIIARSNLEGIGASFQNVDGYTVVAKIIRGGAAETEGHLKVEDKIIAVGEGETGELVDVVDMKLKDVARMTRGKPHTVVRLQVVSLEDPKPREIKITRAAKDLKGDDARGEIFDAGRLADGKPCKVGVIDLPSFYMNMEGARQGKAEFKSSTRDVRRILQDFKYKGVDAVVLDLRTNGGGSLTEAISLTGLFIKSGPVAQVKGNDGRVTAYNDPDPTISWSGPLVVLTSKRSASASEILAGAIQDYSRGLIVGDRSTHGSGTVSSILDLGAQLFKGVPDAPKMGALMMTLQQLYRPGGESTQRRGVISDIELPSLSTHRDIGEDDLDYSLPYDKVPPQTFEKLDQVNSSLIVRLHRLSAARCAASEKFQQVERDIVRYRQQKARKVVKLNEAKFLKERADLNAAKKEEKAIGKLNKNSSGIDRDFYLDEVFNIVTDYMNHAQSRELAIQLKPLAQDPPGKHQPSLPGNAADQALAPPRPQARQKPGEPNAKKGDLENRTDVASLPQTPAASGERKGTHTQTRTTNLPTRGVLHGTRAVPIPPSYKSVAFSADGRRVAFGVGEDGDMRAVIDGRAELAYNNVTVVEFSPYENHYYYAGKRNDKWLLVKDGKEIADLGTLTSLTKGTGLHEIGGKNSFTMWHTLAIWFAEKADNYLILCYKDDEGRVFNDGNWSPIRFGSFWQEGIALSPDGGHHCFAVGPPGSRSPHMYIDGKMGPSFDGVDSALYLLPGNRLLYRAQHGSTWAIMSGDESLGKYGSAAGRIIGSSDRRHFAVPVDAADGQQAVVVDGRKGPAFPKVFWTQTGFLSIPGSFTWSKDYSSYAYVVCTSTTKSAGTEKAPMAVVHNGKRLKEYPEIRIWSIALSPDGAHVAYAAKVAENWVVVVDEIESKPLADVGNPVFLGQAVDAVYPAKTQEGWTIHGLVDCGPFLEVGQMAVSPDNQHVSFAAKLKERQWFVFSDSKPISEPCDAIIGNTGIRIDEDGTIRFVCKKGNDLVWVEKKGF
ncbi:MAG: carboxy terminal-processing peptidase [Planctomycetota bacterium]|nr:carboxy terminal-processing peptidase [Planctomycetota bacterium]